MVRVRHANGYDTAYLHLSKRLVRVGQTVEQGQRIGLVGATGLATGAHLDFRIRRNGKYTDFQRMKLPRVAKISADQMDAFAAERDRLATMMESGRPPDEMILADGTVLEPAAPAAPAD
jgi:murein DD-endopeptidase MepM/ murein hydrolase activator NlpD